MKDEAPSETLSAALPTEACSETFPVPTAVANSLTVDAAPLASPPEVHDVGRPSAIELSPWLKAQIDHAARNNGISRGLFVRAAIFKLLEAVLRGEATFPCTWLIERGTPFYGSISVNTPEKASRKLALAASHQIEFCSGDGSVFFCSEKLPRALCKPASKTVSFRLALDGLATLALPAGYFGVTHVLLMDSQEIVRKPIGEIYIADADGFELAENLQQQAATLTADPTPTNLTESENAHSI